MKIAVDEQAYVDAREYGPDPVLMKKKGLPSDERNIADFKKKIKDDNYMDHAIDRIALELMHFLAK